MKILVIEDEHRIAQSIKKGLEQERYTVDVAYTGTTGLDEASSGSYDVIVLDRMLPEMDGVAVCKALRDQDIHTPILMLSAKSQLHDKVSGLDGGADDYLTKPFSFEELLARIRALSRRPEHTTDTTLTVEDVHLDPTLFTVIRAGVPISLSQKEFVLLEFLMRHAGNVMSKNHIISHVWNYDADILPNTVEVYIRKLRTKIDRPFSNHPELIHTLRGFGYKFGR